ncbi:immunoglobulin gamma-1 heavy chain-like [Pelodiscus sinensis]|uniref:immunoglobulin gamma-1 heavy chain-like n=1 Tax=Pelodiscus sinensis TaxID=13735 RepID=UPI003F6BCA6A
MSLLYTTRVRRTESYWKNPAFSSAHCTHVLPHLVTASEEEIQILQSPTELWLTSGKNAQLDCKISEEEVSTMWYKEQQNGGLQWIHQSSKFNSSEGKYSSKVDITAKMYSLIISNVQRNDSGVYYCGLFSFLYLQPNFGNGTRLVVTDASEPRLSILAPSDPGDAELPHDVPLLCLLSDFTPPWSVLWDTGEGPSEGQTDAGAIDGEGIFSIWSLTTIPSEWWNQETSCTCTAKESGTGRHISATIAMETGPVSCPPTSPASLGTYPTPLTMALLVPGRTVPLSRFSP